MRPSGSEDAPARAVTVSGAVPLDGVTVSRATGGWLAPGEVAVTTPEAEPVPPLSSVTSKVTVQVPAANVCRALGSVCGPTTVPSPKSNLYDTICPSGSADPPPCAATVNGAPPFGGVSLSRATGGLFGAVGWNS